MKGIPRKGYKTESRSGLKIRSLNTFLCKFWYKIFDRGNFSLQGERLFLLFPTLSARLGSTFFSGGVHISWKISTGGVLIFREYLISVTGVLIKGTALDLDIADFHKRWRDDILLCTLCTLFLFSLFCTIHTYALHSIHTLIFTQWK